MRKNRDNKRKLSEILFNAFANTDYCNPQESQYFWAIEEGFHRVKRFTYSFSISCARKEHTCMRKCRIQPGDNYFAPLGVWSGGGKFCASCMAMILYYLDVENLPVFQYDYWDGEKNEPHASDDSTMVKAIINLSKE